MTGDRQSQLRPGDPRRLGHYDLVGRLGEGGMGTVFLARSPTGPMVALKMIRPDLAHDPEFRRRFRGEVERAQQVPPFCTAEVLDADPDHEHPYLVVEYVDGPSLAAVVEERGPLSAANLHGLAIGVATALTAIHGAGVIHRDLKPSNVLLAPGSPKVIDFGIARAMHGAVQHTRTDQMIGTFAYMAPERFGPLGGTGTGTTVTAAADIFAWGAVVAYAGTGRTPFAADSPAALAVSIMTQPPDLSGLVPPLRELVELALTKDPADRPTARDLLDRLLTAAPYRSSELAVALARQPDLLLAAEEAQAATDQQPVPGAAAALPGAAAALPGAPVLAGATTRLVPAPDAVAPRGAAPVPPAATRPVTAPPPPAPAVPAGRRWKWIAVIAVLTSLVVVSLTVAGVLSGAIPLAGDPDAGRSAGPSAPPASVVLLADPLTSANRWQVRDDPEHGTTCTFAGALVVTKQSLGSYRCPGPVDVLTDFSLEVDVELLTRGSCASVWFRFDTAGYALRVCAEGYELMAHGDGNASAVTTLRTFRFPTALGLNTAVRVGISAQGGTLAFHRDRQPVGNVTDTRFAQGRAVLGIFQDKAGDEPPYSVSFANIEVRTPTG